jgi:hypothetical protein
MRLIEFSASQIRRRMAAITFVKVGTTTCIRNPKQFFEPPFYINLPVSDILLER